MECCASWDINRAQHDFEKKLDRLFDGCSYLLMPQMEENIFQKHLIASGF